MLLPRRRGPLTIATRPAGGVIHLGLGAAESRAAFVAPLLGVWPLRAQAVPRDVGCGCCLCGLGRHRRRLSCGASTCTGGGRLGAQFRQRVTPASPEHWTPVPGSAAISPKRPPARHNRSSQAPLVTNPALLETERPTFSHAYAPPKTPRTPVADDQPPPTPTHKPPRTAKCPPPTHRLENRRRGATSSVGSNPTPAAHRPANPMVEPPERDGHAPTERRQRP